MGNPKSVVDIVLVAYRSEKFIPRLLNDIRSMTELPYRLYFFDNIGNRKTLSYLWNNLASMGSSEYLVIMNPDIALSPSWDLKLVKAIKSEPRAGVAIPVSVWAPIGPGGLPTAESMAQLSKERKKSDEVIVKDVQESPITDFTFYLPLIPRKIFSELKGLDERLRFYRSDSEFFVRLRNRLGKVVVYAVGCPIWHQGGASTGEAESRKEIDVWKEYAHSDTTWNAIREGRLKEWDRLSDAERSAVRLNPSFNRMGIYA